MKVWILKKYRRGKREEAAENEEEEGEEEEYDNTSMGIIRVKGVLRRTVCSDWPFNILSGSHLQNQVTVGN